jgi:YesN/AraC family two-component response regulator
MTKVLVVEDEPGLQEGLAHNLRFASSVSGTPPCRF